MAEAQELSDIEYVDVRDIWPNEARDFTPWLAKNLSKLGDALGLELELDSTEVPVGSYFLDILAHDLGSDRRPVIIENQLDATDHGHLGQLLTYASGHDAHIVVWIAGEFKDEHRQALDWLNQRCDKNTEFFGVVIEALRIDDSRPAPHFRLVLTPNDSGVRRKRRDTSAPNEKYKAFFQDLVSRLSGEDASIKKVKESVKSRGFYSGYAGAEYHAAFEGDKARVSLLLYNSGNQDHNNSLFNALEDRREAIQSELQEELNWERWGNSRNCRIDAIQDGRAITNDDETLESTKVWMIEEILKFKKVFEPKLKELTS